MSTRTHNATGSAVSVLYCWLKTPEETERTEDTEEIDDQSMERNQVEGEDVEVCFKITCIQFCLSDKLPLLK